MEMVKEKSSENKLGRVCRAGVKQVDKKGKGLCCSKALEVSLNVTGTLSENKIKKFEETISHRLIRQKRNQVFGQ